MKFRLEFGVRRNRQRGISLIELMVGLAIGIVTVLTILQLLSFWEQRKRTVTAGNDAQMSGTLAAFSLDRDLRLAGYGFGLATDDVMGCQVTATNSLRSPPDISFSLRPVEIVQGTNDAPDEIRVLYGNSAYFVSTQPFLESAAETKKFKSRDGFLPGDRLVIAGNTPVDCVLIEVTGQAIADDKTIEHQAGKNYTTLAGLTRVATMNPVGGTGTTFSAGRAYNLGPAPVQNIWRVDPTTRSLTRYNRLVEPDTSAVEVASDVVTLKAQYGIDANGDGEIASGEWTNAAVTDWTSVRAVRFAILVRSRQYERPDASTGTPVTTAAPTWFDTAFVMKNVDGSTDSGNGAAAVTGAGATNNWRNYRYRVYDYVVPLRNMIWGTAP